MGSLGWEEESRISIGRASQEWEKLRPDSVINLDHGDPVMFESFWRETGDRSAVVLSGSQSISYFSDARNICWFLEPEFAQEVKRLHEFVGNAEVADRHIVVGNGSTQLFQAALYALSPSDAPEPMSVVSAVPYYSSYPSVTDFVKSSLYRWAGDANAFDGDAPCIELVTSPNNPDGSVRRAVVNTGRARPVYDLAYYWPQYTPITAPVSHDLMLFTVSKCTGHAGIRIGWALVQDPFVAKKMTKFIELNTIGVSRDSQLRAAKIMRCVREGYEIQDAFDSRPNRFFDNGRQLMADRWNRLREAVDPSPLFSLPEFPSHYCNFFGEIRTSYPAFAWLKCEREGDDCETFLQGHMILTRGGKHFGAGPEYVRISMLDRDDVYELFLGRLSNISRSSPPE